MKKRYKIILITITLILSLLLINQMQYRNDELYAVNLKSSIDKNLVSILVSDGSDNYTKYEGNTFPSNTEYTYNSELSKCQDNNGNVIEGILSYDEASSKVSIRTKKTTNCYLYFDKKEVKQVLVKSHVMIYSEGTSTSSDDSLYFEDDIIIYKPFTSTYLQYLNNEIPEGVNIDTESPTLFDAIALACEQGFGRTSLRLYYGSNFIPLQERAEQGIYIESISEVSRTTTEVGSYHWAGYIWKIYLNDTVEEWNESTRTGLVEYGNEVKLVEGDQIYLIYDFMNSEW